MPVTGINKTNKLTMFKQTSDRYNYYKSSYTTVVNYSVKSSYC